MSKERRKRIPYAAKYLLDKVSGNCQEISRALTALSGDHPITAEERQRLLTKIALNNYDTVTAITEIKRTALEEVNS